MISTGIRVRRHVNLSISVKYIYLTMLSSFPYTAFQHFWALILSEKKNRMLAQKSYFSALQYPVPFTTAQRCTALMSTEWINLNFY